MWTVESGMLTTDSVWLAWPRVRIGRCAWIVGSIRWWKMRGNGRSGWMDHQKSSFEAIVEVVLVKGPHPFVISWHLVDSVHCFDHGRVVQQLRTTFRTYGLPKRRGLEMSNRMRESAKNELFKGVQENGWCREGKLLHDNSSITFSYIAYFLW